jgi:hypothetical protein
LAFSSVASRDSQPCFSYASRNAGSAAERDPSGYRARISCTSP